MKYLALIVLLVSPLLAVGLTINTPPSVVVCQPTLLSWSNGTAPFFLSFLPAGQTMAAHIKDFPQQTGTSLTWIADLPAGTTFTIQLKDSSGEVAYSDIVTVGSSSDTSCVNTTVSATSGATSTTAPAGTTPTATTPGATTTGASSRASGTQTASGAAASKTNAASRPYGSFGWAGILGIVGAVIF